MWGSALRVAVAAPPEAGKANAALVRYLAELFGVKRRAVEVVSGHGRSLKRIAIAGLTAEAARARLE
jgi:hypothetical protein